MQLIDLFKKYPSKGKLHFLKIYENYFKGFKNKKINILEIGVHEGKSLMIWKEHRISKWENRYFLRNFFFI